jgi:hypothetical protein
VLQHGPHYFTFRHGYSQAAPQRARMQKKSLARRYRAT